MTAPTPVPAAAPREPTLRQLAVGALPPNLLASVLQESELRKQETAATVLVVGQKEWGKNLGEASIRALITWGKAWDVDVATEVDILGGNIYRNANYYLRKLAEMVDLELVDYACADYVHIDDRLDKIGTPEAKTEILRRLSERIKYGLRDESAAICIFRIKLHNLSEEIIGSAECGWKGTGSRPGKADPVGNTEPVKTSETRSIRRAMRKVTTHIPAFDAKEKALDEASKAIGVQLGAEIHDNKHAAKDQAGAHAQAGLNLAKRVHSGDPYADAQDATGGKMEPLPRGAAAVPIEVPLIPPQPPAAEDGDPGIV